MRQYRIYIYQVQFTFRIWAKKNRPLKLFFDIPAKSEGQAIKKAERNIPATLQQYIAIKKAELNSFNSICIDAPWNKEQNNQ